MGKDIQFLCRVLLKDSDGAAARIVAVDTVDDTLHIYVANTQNKGDGIATRHTVKTEEVPYEDVTKALAKRAAQVVPHG